MSWIRTRATVVRISSELEWRWHFEQLQLSSKNADAWRRESSVSSFDTRKKKRSPKKVRRREGGDWDLGRTFHVDVHGYYHYLPTPYIQYTYVHRCIRDDILGL